MDGVVFGAPKIEPLDSDMKDEAEPFKCADEKSDEVAVTAANGLEFAYAPKPDDTVLLDPFEEDSVTLSVKFENALTPPALIAAKGFVFEYMLKPNPVI